MAGDLLYKLLMKTHYDMNNVIWSAYEIFNLIWTLGAYVWKVRREFYGILVRNWSIVMMNRLVYYEIVEIAC